MHKFMKTSQSSGNHLLDYYKMMRQLLLTFTVIISINVQAQQPFKTDSSDIRLYSFLKIRYGSIIDLRTNKNIIDILGPWGESKWYKQNDSVFLIDFYVYSIPMARNRPSIKYRLEIYSDSFSLIRNRKYIGYPIITKDQLNEIKAKSNKPCGNILFENKSKNNTKKASLKDSIENYLSFIDWTAIAIMNGHNEFIEIFNSLQSKNCCGAQCNEAYYENQYVLHLFEFEIVNRKLVSKKG